MTKPFPKISAMRTAPSLHTYTVQTAAQHRVQCVSRNTQLLDSKSPRRISERAALIGWGRSSPLAGSSARPLVRARFQVEFRPSYRVVHDDPNVLVRTLGKLAGTPMVLLSLAERLHNWLSIRVAYIMYSVLCITQV